MFTLVIVGLFLSACAVPKLILSPNAHVQLVCEEVTQRDVGECREMAKSAGPMPSQGKSWQIAGNTAAGGAIGSASGTVGGATAGFLRWLWAPVSPIGSERSGKL